MYDSDSEMALIMNFVDAYRTKYRITPSPGVKPELSCIAFGEGWNLLNTQLIYTTDGSGYWPLIKSDSEIRKLVLDQIEIENQIEKLRMQKGK